MNSSITERAIACFALFFAAVDAASLLIWFPGTIASDTDDWISILFLSLAALAFFRNVGDGIGLLCAAWSFTIALVFRSWLWREASLWSGSLDPSEELGLSIIRWSLVIILVPWASSVWILARRMPPVEVMDHR
jgi:hypothetical protein